MTRAEAFAQLERDRDRLLELAAELKDIAARVETGARALPEEGRTEALRASLHVRSGHLGARYAADAIDQRVLGTRAAA